MPKGLYSFLCFCAYLLVRGSLLSCPGAVRAREVRIRSGLAGAVWGDVGRYGEIPTGRAPPGEMWGEMAGAVWQAQGRFEP